MLRPYCPPAFLPFVCPASQVYSIFKKPEAALRRACCGGLDLHPQLAATLGQETGGGAGRRAEALGDGQTRPWKDREILYRQGVNSTSMGRRKGVTGYTAVGMAPQVAQNVSTLQSLCRVPGLGRRCYPSVRRTSCFCFHHVFDRPLNIVSDHPWDWPIPTYIGMVAGVGVGIFHTWTWMVWVFAPSGFSNSSGFTDVQRG